MKLSNRAIESLNRFGEYNTPNYKYYISSDNGKEYVKRCTVRRYNDGHIVVGSVKNVQVWEGNSWKIF